ncbi:zinc-ribbon domain-containing protein [Streptomyces sp. NPDC048473]|uniref:zinc-ribbon domain-containing protein n=1 Tax=unclassified Streptomyces TaxID=2593676 RepID=UPI00371B7761
MNGALTPAEITAGSNAPVWWRCPAGHDPRSAQAAQVFLSRQGCPRCRKRTSVSRQEKELSAEPARPHGRRAAVPSSDTARPFPARRGLPSGTRPDGRGGVRRLILAP